MHELSLAQAMIEQVEEILAKEDCETATGVTVRIGALSGVDPRAFEFAYPLAAEGTILANAALTIEEAPAEVRCEACGRTSRPDVHGMLCGHCGSDRIRIVSGRDIVIRAVEFEERRETDV